MFKSIKAVAAAAVLAAGFAGTASAGEYRPGYKQVTTYKTVHETVYDTVYDTIYVDVVKSVPYQKTVTKYDHCGKPYCVTITCYKDVTVKVPKQVARQVARTVCKTVPVTTWIKVCDY